MGEIDSLSLNYNKAEDSFIMIKNCNTKQFRLFNNDLRLTDSQKRRYQTSDNLLADIRKAKTLTPTIYKHWKDLCHNAKKCIFYNEKLDKCHICNSEHTSSHYRNDSNACPFMKDLTKHIDECTASFICFRLHAAIKHDSIEKFLEYIQSYIPPEMKKK